MDELIKTANILVVALICAGCVWLGHYTTASKTNCFTFKPVGELLEQMK